jgi:hypothetical protein
LKKRRQPDAISRYHHSTPAQKHGARLVMEELQAVDYIQLFFASAPGRIVALEPPIRW